MNTPKIRFKGFTDDWEQRKLGNYIIEYQKVTNQNNQYPVLTSSRKGIFLQTDYYSGNQVASDDNTGYNIVPYGYFTYRHMSDDEIFHFNINDIVENGIVSTLYPVFTTTDYLDSRYLQYQLNYGQEFAKFAVLQKQGGSRTYMYLNKLKTLHLTMPKTIDEQKQISGYFMKLDHLITLHQRRCDETKQLKKFMLQKMFPKNGEKNPEIRFEGFTDDWEQRKVSEIAIEKLANGIMNNQVNHETGLRHINVINMYDTDKIHPEKLTFSGYDEDAVKKCNVEFGDIFLTRSSLKPEGIAEANVLLDSGRFVYDDHLIRLKVDKEKYDPFFVKLNLSERAFKRQFIVRAKTTAFTTIGQEDIAECSGLFPKKEEQEKIGTCFSTLDHLITLHQRRCDETKQLKKFMLQKMFPKNGEKNPEIRFEGFTDDWEQRKVSEIAIEKLANGIMNNQVNHETGLRHINVINMYDTDKIHPEKLTFSGYDEDAVKKCNVEFGDIFLTRSSLKPEGIAEANVLLDSGRFVYDDHLIRLKVDKEKYDPFFVKLNLSERAFKRQFIVRAKTTAFTTIGQEDIAECSGLFPKKEEQEKIGTCFSTLDHLITLHQRKCEKLKELKQYMLQNMFV